MTNILRSYVGEYTPEYRDPLQGVLGIKDITKFGYTKFPYLVGQPFVDYLVAEFTRPFTEQIAEISQGTTLASGRALLGANGMLYAINSENFVKVNPATDTPVITDNKSSGHLTLAIGTNGQIYGTPSFNSLIRINPFDDKLSSYNTPYDNEFMRGIMGFNGMIYMVGRETLQVQKLNPATNTISTIRGIDNSYDLYSNLGDAATKRNHGGACLAPNGSIYIFSIYIEGILKIDTNTDTVSLIAAPAFSGKRGSYSGGVLAPNGMIYIIPRGGGQIAKLDPNSDTVTFFGTSYDNNKGFTSGTLAPNGKIYAFPLRGVEGVLRLDPSGDSVTILPDTIPNDNYNSGILAPNGCIYSFGSTKIIRLGVPQVIPETVTRHYLSPHINKCN